MSAPRSSNSGGSRSDSLRDRFAAFWKSYPRKVGKDAAWKAWQKRRPNAELLAEMLAALAWQSTQENWLREGGRYVPNPATYLNQGRWQDEPSKIPSLTDRNVRGMIAAAGMGERQGVTVTAIDKPAFAEAFTRLAAALGKDVDLIGLQVVFDALAPLEIELVVAAAERLAESAAFFPKPAEWRAMAGKIEAERRAAQRRVLRTLPSALCPICEDTGWAVVGEGATDRGYTATRRAQPCGCQEQRRLELLNRQPSPLLLPAGTPRAATSAEFTQAESAAVVGRFERARRGLLKVMPNARVERTDYTGTED